MLVLHMQYVLLGRLDLDNKGHLGKHAVLLDSPGGARFFELAALYCLAGLLALWGRCQSVPSERVGELSDIRKAGK